MKTRNDNQRHRNLLGGSPKQSTIAGSFYTESEPDFSNFAINSLSTFVLPLFFSEFKSESDDSECYFSSVFMNLDICVFLPYICILLNKLTVDFFIYF